MFVCLCRQERGSHVAGSWITWKTQIPWLGSYAHSGYPLNITAPANAEVLMWARNGADPEFITSFSAPEGQGYWVFYGWEWLYTSFTRLLVYAFSLIEVPLVGLNYLPNYARTAITIRHDLDYNNWDAAWVVMQGYEEARGLKATYYADNTSNQYGNIDAHSTTIKGWINAGYTLFGSHSLTHVFNHDNYADQWTEVNESFTALENILSPVSTYWTYGRDFANPLFASNEYGLMALEAGNVSGSGSYGGGVYIPFHYFLNDTNIGVIGAQSYHLTGLRPFFYAEEGSWRESMEKMQSNQTRYKQLLERNYLLAIPFSHLQHDWAPDMTAYNKTLYTIEAFVAEKGSTRVINLYQAEFCDWWRFREDISISATWDGSKVTVTMSQPYGISISNVSLTVYHSQKVGALRGNGESASILHDTFLNNPVQLSYVLPASLDDGDTHYLYFGDFADAPYVYSWSNLSYVNESYVQRNLTVNVGSRVNSALVKVNCTSYGAPTTIHNGTLLSYNDTSCLAMIHVTQDQIIVSWRPYPPPTFYVWGGVAAAGGGFAYWLYRKKRKRA